MATLPLVSDTCESSRFLSCRWLYSSSQAVKNRGWFPKASVSITRHQLVSTDEQEPLIWVSVEMRNEDRLTGVLILDKLVVGTDYGEIIIPLQGDWSITFASKDGDGDEVTFMGPTRISEHSSSGSGDANRLMGHVTPDRIRIRLVNGQELEIGRDQIRAVTYVGSRRR